MSDALRLAVMANALAANPIRDVALIKSKGPPEGCPAIDGRAVARPLWFVYVHLTSATKVRLRSPFTGSDCHWYATGTAPGSRGGADYGEAAGALTISGTIVRVGLRGEGLIARRRYQVRCWGTARSHCHNSPSNINDTAASSRTLGEHPTIIFPSPAGTWRNPNNIGRDWRRVRRICGIPDVTMHSFARP